MKQIGEQMLVMVLNILDVHKCEESQMTVDKTTISLFNTSKNAINKIAFLAEQKNIAITNEINQSSQVNADNEIIERVFVNILTNAIKYTPNNGKITLNTVFDKEKQDFVTIKVADTGEGISSDKVHLVFTKFSQVKAKKSGSIRSTGLGLTFCKMAVEAHGGEISVDSELNKGTVFSFTLQLQSNKIAIEKPEETTPQLQKTYSLISEEKEKLAPYVAQLKETEIYKMLKLRKILRQINDESDNLKSWKEEIQNAIRSGNQKKYNELLKI